MVKKFIFFIFTITLSISFNAEAKTCKLSIEGNDMMKYNVASLKVNKDCKKVALTLKHSGKLAKNIMGHNWVLSTTADMAAVTTASMAAGLAKEYLAKGPKVLAATKLLGGGQSDTITFDVAKLRAASKKGTKYSYFCTFPGHSAMMKGSLVFE